MKDLECPIAPPNDEESKGSDRSEHSPEMPGRGTGVLTDVMFCEATKKRPPGWAAFTVNR